VTLSALVRDAGGEARDLGIARDDLRSLKTMFESARGSDLIVTTAGISVGDHDYVRAAFEELGGTIHFWKVRMRPGAPLAFGTLDDVPWIGLSGNPVSAMITFELFVRPAIRKMLGFTSLFPATVPVKLFRDVTIAAPLMHFMRVVLTRNKEGELIADLAGSQSSSVMTAMARANALLILPGDRLEYSANEEHRALPLGDSLSTADQLVLN
jgi:molybdopterin molybdotransferase